MPILSGDVKLLKSERLLDTPDGGGRMTGQEVVDGVSNNLFPDISELDRTYGRVSLRKAFVAVLTDDTHSYMGAHAIVERPPQDPLVDVTLFSTKDWTDRRVAAQDRIERYLARGIRWPGQLLERQLTGQRAIALLLKPGDRLPAIGQSMVLVQDEGKSTEQEQYVRITRISTVEREFRIQGATWIGVIATCEISDPLRYDFEGAPPSPFDDVQSRAVARDTMVANAAMYYGIKPLTTEAKLGDMRVQVDSIFGQLVPSAQSETPMVDLTAAGQMSPVVDSATGLVTFTTSALIGPALSLFLGNPCLPGTLRITTSTGAEILDDGGQLRVAGVVVGIIDYGRGLLTFGAGVSNYTGTKTVRFRPAASPLRVADTASIFVRQESRGYVYIITLIPPPQPGSLIVSYMAQGKWYDLRDDGSGALRGADSAFGTGSIDFVTGSVIATFGALPDANTEVLFAWAAASNFFNRSATPVSPPAIKFNVQNPGISPNSLVIRWTDGANQREARDNGRGNLTGNATGRVRYAQGEISMTTTTLPAGGATFTIEYSHGDVIEEVFDGITSDAGNGLWLTLANDDILPGSVSVDYTQKFYEYVWDSTVELPNPMRISPPVNPIMRLQDVDGEWDADVDGSVDYTTGVLNIVSRRTIDAALPKYDLVEAGTDPGGLAVWRLVMTGFAYVPVYVSFDYAGQVRVRYRLRDTDTAFVETLTISGLNIDVTENFGESIVSGSVRFTLGGKTYIDRLGLMFTDVDAATGSGILAGTIDYSTGNVSLTQWQPGGANTLAVQSLLTELQGHPVDEVTFRVPGAPVRSGSLQVRGTPLTGGIISATAASDGTIKTTAMDGTVDYQTGIVRIRFGQWVPAAGNEGEIWFNPNAIDLHGRIFKPAPVFADTIRFNAVVYTYLPLSSDILGLDPVRLPQDGRVPIYRPGDVIVVHNTASAPFPNGVTGGYTLNIGRVRLSSLRVIDATGKVFPVDRYTADLDAGTVTLKTPLDLTGYVEPLRAEHRIEDMGLISDVQINGMLTMTRPLTHDYPPNASHASSALIIGDLQARDHTLFSQSTWTNVWSDSLIGTTPIGQYNNTVYPVAVTNRGAIEERWALIFTSATEFRVVGQSVGQIAVGNVATDLSPTNPETLVPYFTLRSLGWGAGWATGNVLRFNTAGANFPLWIARTVLQGPATYDGDDVKVQTRGDVDRE
ncbi:MAG: hypothetical protein LBE75_06495 [Burkholderiales bacterium]|jgi:hypothetical protein|nr:hypothetical protein [Burkholderiales bacterium]